MAAEMAELADACVSGVGRRLNMVVAGLMTNLSRQLYFFKPVSRPISISRADW